MQSSRYLNETTPPRSYALVKQPLTAQFKTSFLGREFLTMDDFYVPSSRGSVRWAWFGEKTRVLSGLAVWCGVDYPPDGPSAVPVALTVSHLVSAKWETCPVHQWTVYSFNNRWVSLQLCDWLSVCVHMMGLVTVQCAPASRKETAGDRHQPPTTRRETEWMDFLVPTFVSNNQCYQF